MATEVSASFMEFEDAFDLETEAKLEADGLLSINKRETDAFVILDVRGGEGLELDENLPHEFRY